MKKIIEDLTREMHILKREYELEKREKELLIKERDQSHQMSEDKKITSGVTMVNINLNLVKDLVLEFKGEIGSLQNWAKHVVKVVDTYKLDDNNARALMSMRLEGKAKKWLQ